MLLAVARPSLILILSTKKPLLKIHPISVEPNLSDMQMLSSRSSHLKTDRFSPINPFLNAESPIHSYTDIKRSVLHESPSQNSPQPRNNAKLYPASYANLNDYNVDASEFDVLEGEN